MLDYVTAKLGGGGGGGREGREELDGGRKLETQSLGFYILLLFSYFKPAVCVDRSVRCLNAKAVIHEQ